MKRLGKRPDIQASDSGSAARHSGKGSGTVLGGKGSLRRGNQRRALAPCAPFRQVSICDRRLYREPDVQLFLRLAKDENQRGVDKTS